MSIAPSRLRRRLHALLAGGLLCAYASAAPAPDDQRAAFRQAYAAARAGGEGWHQWDTQLRGYVLYPYLEAAALSHDIRQADPAQIRAYLDRYPEWIPASDLRRDFLAELARREDWDDFLALYKPGLGDALTCDALQGRLAQGQTLQFDRDLASLWSKPSLPSACDPVLGAARAQGLLTSGRVWERIESATAAGQGGTVASMAGLLDGDQAQSAQRLALALRDPASASAAAAQWEDTPHEREAAAIALQRLARRQSAQADQAWQTLQSRFAFSTQQRNRILHALALFHATDFSEDALDRLAALPPAAQTDASREWRVRVALAQQQWTAALQALDALSATQRASDEWRYYRGRVLGQLGQSTQAQTLLASIASKPTFFGFLAADRLQRPYSICPRQLAADPQREQALLADPGLRRAFELYAVGLPRYARREWTQALAGADAAQLRLAADLAYRQGWYDRPIFSFNSGDSLRLYEQRFPLASQDGVVAQAQQAGIEPAWAYGILRAESSWVSDARSGANARGLMQLVPDTAELVARRNGLDWEGAESLYDPAVNIRLGTRYLAQMAERFDGSPWLASAAYNAGPGRVDQWLANRGSLPPDLFIATIPYSETREYVARVMAFTVIYDWRLHQDVVPMQQRLVSNGQPYRLPDSSTPRKPVECQTISDTPEAPPAPPAAASSTPASSSSASGP